MAGAIAGGRGFGHVAREGTSAQLLAAIVGATFLLVGVLGFIPGITTDYSSMEWAGHDSGAQLLGVFDVSVLHNLVHLGFGAVGLLLVGTHETARWYLVGGGLLYLGVWLYGLAVDETSDANFLPVNDADNWLHFVLGAGMVLLGLWAWSPTRRMSRT